MEIIKDLYGRDQDGKEVYLFTLRNKSRVTVQIINYGGIITSILVPDRHGEITDIVQGFDELSDYSIINQYFGAIIGRYANRIAGGRFKLDGKEYNLSINDGENHLHGGIKGFNRVIWDAEIVADKTGDSVRLTYLSKDGEEGYPGNLKVTITYSLSYQNELSISYEAETDKPTIVNLTNHSFFNLSASGSGNILNHELMIRANHYTEIGKGLIPNGEIKKVFGSPFDFTEPQKIGSRIKETNGGYDHNFVLNKRGKELSLAAYVFEPTTGRSMEVYTTEPGLQFYSGNFFDGSLKGKGGKAYKKHSGFCLEAQHFPDSPNKPDFPATTLNPGEIYKQLTIYKFN